MDLLEPGSPIRFRLREQARQLPDLLEPGSPIRFRLREQARQLPDLLEPAARSASDSASKRVNSPI